MAYDLTHLRDLIGALVGDGDGSEIYGELDAIADVDAGADARISELESQLADAEGRYKDTAARNYELMQAVTSKDSSDEGTGEDSEPTPETDSDIINSLITEQ